VTLKEPSGRAEADKALSGEPLRDGFHELIWHGGSGAAPDLHLGGGRGHGGKDMTVVMDFGGGDSAIIDSAAVHWVPNQGRGICARGYVTQGAGASFGGRNADRGYEAGSERSSFRQLQGPETFRR